MADDTTIEIHDHNEPAPAIVPSSSMPTERKSNSANGTTDLQPITSTAQDEDNSAPNYKQIIAKKAPPPEPPKRNFRKRIKRRKNPNQPVVLNKCLQCAKNYVLPILVSIISGISWFVGGVLLIPTAYAFEDHPILFILNQLVACFEVVSAVTSYFNCLRTSPGYVQPDWENTKCSSVEDRNALVDLEPQKTGEARYCHKCGIYQPPRSHHSSVHNKYVFFKKF
jgi:hypothetical protein